MGVANNATHIFRLDFKPSLLQLLHLTGVRPLQTQYLLAPHGNKQVNQRTATLQGYGLAASFGGFI